MTKHLETPVVDLPPAIPDLPNELNPNLSEEAVEEKGQEVVEQVPEVIEQVEADHSFEALVDESDEAHVYKKKIEQAAREVSPDWEYLSHVMTFAEYQKLRNQHGLE